MRTSDFDYYLPPERIAQHPIEPRHNARLLVYDRKTGKMDHRIFYDLPEYLNAGDVLVINQTRVIPARIFGFKPSGGKVEILLLKRESDLVWEALVGGKKIREGTILQLVEGPLAVVEQVLDGARRLIRFETEIEPYLEKQGQMPLPPYIHEKLEDPERYQTVFARQPGSAAAPTAGLHFTPELIQLLEQKGILFGRVTLHVGLDTFAPVTEEDPRQHAIHSEWCELDEETASLINSARAKGGRIIAVGTTSVRTLESAGVNAQSGQVVAPFHGSTRLYILPGFTFKAVDAMITNFHLPRSTLLMLVSAFAGREQILRVYEEAIRREYRFYSFGDAMLIL
ncbi:S-adenosylmethionine--tRNA ribosyltransferase-isomerase [Bellilinea caldifistulae]|uniref:S-adenosylmethionine:tRNA ribosyltransferase-isomerase n=1 Tax=Bellilinea caldifistulae TaxID=360411 RepID=A0A0P6XPX8_9CHLR|nr:S-adenosylmethionine tRNA ribosyltransferase [Bellilinea caldifistulae]GAP10450.1 S-adenosylmethionine--tRNA ribosyltransferase-isomerase [Bellilinea caldifistulae]